MNINLKEPATILAIMLILGMIVGPWFAHDRTLTRIDGRLAGIEEKLLNVQARMTGAETTLQERRLTFEEAIHALRRVKANSDWPTTTPTPPQH